MERDMGSMGNGMGKAYFNSHAHVERDFKTLGAKRYAYISTHTLTWSVTVRIVATLQLFSISTHTLTWSVTGCMGYFFLIITDFNSHAHVERDTRILRQ